MGMSLVVCVFCALTLIEHRRRWAVWLVPSIGLALTLLVLTRSRVSTFIVILMLAIMLNKIARDFFLAACSSDGGGRGTRRCNPICNLRCWQKRKRRCADGLHDGPQ